MLNHFRVQTVSSHIWGKPLTQGRSTVCVPVHGQPSYGCCSDKGLGVQDEINKICRFPGRGPTWGFCLRLTTGLWGFGPFCACTPPGNPAPAGVPRGTLFTHSTVWKSVRLQIRCSETNVITLTRTCRFPAWHFCSP